MSILLDTTSITTGQGQSNLPHFSLIQQTITEHLLGTRYCWVPHPEDTELNKTDQVPDLLEYPSKLKVRSTSKENNKDGRPSRILYKF